MHCKQFTNKLLLFFVLLLVTSCNIPKDPQNSWENIQKEGLHVGVITNPPYTTQNDSSFTGSEVALIQNFANENNLKISFESGNETDLTDKLENYELDILIGGFTKKTIWVKNVGLSTPYDKDDHVFLIPKGENKLLHFLESFIFKTNKK